jgi:Flp pilus assembly protein TadD
MKKTSMIVIAGLLTISGLKAQSLQEGINYLYADRYKSATNVFEKLLASNPNNIEAIYWLGQTYLDMEEIAGARRTAARQLYEKGLQTSADAPLLLVGIGHVELLEGKNNEARQHFERAITMTRTKKGDDPTILNAVGHANADAKGGDLPYAIEKLEAAVLRDDKNPDIYLNLGNAYRKARPGEGGGQAYTNYHKALSLNPNFAVAYLRLAQLFEAQKNWELFLENLNNAVAKDPNFTAGYYELFYYYFYRAKFTEAEGYLKKYIDSKAPDNEIADEYLYAQLCWARKDFDCAVQKAENVVKAMGNLTKPKVFRLLADAYAQKKDYANAKKYSDEFFVKKNPEDINAFDYKLKADIYSQFPGQEDVVFNSYLEGIKVDTVLDNKIEILKSGAKFFKDNKLRDKEAELLTRLLEIKPKPTLNDYFDQTLAFYFSKQYGKSRDAASKMIERYPTEIYGYDWSFNSSRVIDTVKKDSIAVPDAIKLFDFSAKDTAKYKKQFISSASFLAGYYANDANDKDKAIEYLKKWQAVDTANAMNIQKNIDILQKTPGTKPPANSKGNTIPRQNGQKPLPAIKPKIPATAKAVAVKK